MAATMRSTFTAIPMPNRISTSSNTTSASPTSNLACRVGRRSYPCGAASTLRVQSGLELEEASAGTLVPVGGIRAPPAHPALVQLEHGGDGAHPPRGRGAGRLQPHLVLRSPRARAVHQQVRPPPE